MKNIFKGVLVLACVLVLTGCGKKEVVTCNQKTTGVSLDFIVTLTGKKVTDMEFKGVFKMETNNEAYLNVLEQRDLCATMKTSLSNYTLVGCKQTRESDSIVVSAKIDVDAIKDETIKNSTSAEEIKTSLEKVGYTCTID